MQPSSEARSVAAAWFATTRWTLVLQAQEGDSPAADQALSQLCQSYWRPINSYVRSVGYAAADADDLTQEFFARFLEKQQYRAADHQRGRFRSFLLACLKNFLLKERERAQAQKRGGGWRKVSLDEDPPQGGSRLELPDERAADRIFEQNWASALLSTARARLARDYAREGKAERFACLEQFLPGEESSLTYGEAAQRLGIAEGTLKSDVHRLKHRYATLIREEIAHTVSDPEEIEEELRHLRRVVSRGD
jgi:RNA polymerase sigma-70 factor (ECF subfamily)